MAATLTTTSLTAAGSASISPNRTSPGDNIVTFQITGTYGTLTAVIEGTVDGVNYTTLAAQRYDSPLVDTGTLTIPANTTRVWQAQCNGLLACRFRVVTIASGTVVVTGNSDFFPGSQLGFSVVGNYPFDGTKITYSATSLGIVPASAATDIFEIRNTGTKVIRVLRVATSITAGASALVVPKLVVRSSLNTGGTAYSGPQSSTAQFPFAVPHDANDPAATATLYAYSANPSLGTAVGNLRATGVALNTAGTQLTQQAEWLFGVRPSKGLVLRGTTNSLCVNLGGATITTGLANVDIEWTEE